MTPRGETTQLIKKALEHDEEACTRILNLYKGRIFSYVYRMVRNYHDAEDITFDTFIKCFNALPSFDTSRPFTTWLFTIAHNLTMDHFRKHKIELEYCDELHQSGDDLAGEYEKKRKIERIDHALTQLPPIDRELIILFHKEEHTYQEISEILSIPITTIKTRLHRARKRLHGIVQKKPENE
ncbi:MAG: RNA polymerase sigma factor [candidate division WOR-3 bacterium]|nr:MAG: RNA polymerase sigma factor [candidate division WOR-3 bacterium]